jgi:hypothetical protein
MKGRTSIWVGGIALLVAVVAGAGITARAMAGGGDDSEGPITGDALEKASAAALAETGEGRVTETEVGAYTRSR